MKKKGITLIELIIVIALNSIVLATIYTISLVSNKVIIKTEIQSELQSTAEKIQSQLIYHLESASYIFTINDTMAEDVLYKDLIDYSSDEVSKINIHSMEMKYNDESIIKLNLIDKELSYMILGKNQEVIQAKKTIAMYVEEINIVPSDIRQIKNIKDYSLNGAQGIQINIRLKIRKGYVEMEYPVNTIITFRN